jgi:hypothetical protein
LRHILRAGWVSEEAPEKREMQVIELSVADCINEHRSFSGKPFAADSLTRHHGRVVRFCNAGCRDKFAADPERIPDAVVMFGAIA